MKKLLLGLILVSFLFSQQAWRKMYKNQKVRSEADSTEFIGHTEFKGEVKFKPGWLEIDQMMPLTNDSLSSSLAWWNNPYGLAFVINQYVDTIRSFNTGEQVVLKDVDIIDGKITVDTVKVKGNADADTIWWHREDGQWRMYSNDSSGVVIGVISNDIASCKGSAIIGGRNDTIKANAHYSFIGGGWLNEISTNAEYSAIIGGANHLISGQDYSFIGGGDQNILGGAKSAIVGGYKNEAASGNNLFIGGGSTNKIIGSSTYGCAIIGGNSNTITAPGGKYSEGSFIGGAYFGYIYDSKYSAVIGGRNDSIYGGRNNFIGAGRNNVIRCEESDSNNVAFGNSSIVDTCHSSFAFNCQIKKADSTFGITKQLWVIDGDTTKVTGNVVSTGKIIADTIETTQADSYLYLKFLGSSFNLKSYSSGDNFYFKDWFKIWLTGASFSLNVADLSAGEINLGGRIAIGSPSDYRSHLWFSSSQSSSTSGYGTLWGFTSSNYLVFCDREWVKDTPRDFDHSDQTNPTIFIHSDVDPNTDETQWLSFAHDQTDGVIDVGKGNIKFKNNIEVANGKTFENGVAVVSADFTFDGGDITIIDVDNGWVVADCYVYITVGFDGTGVVTIGDLNDNDGFMDDTDIVQGTGGQYYGDDADEHGDYLWDSGNNHPINYIYTGAPLGGIKAYVTQGTATQGTGTVYVVIQRIK